MKVYSKSLIFALLAFILLMMTLFVVQAQETRSVLVPAGQISAWEEKQRMFDCRQIRAIWDEYCRARCAGDAQAFISIHEIDAYKMPQDRPMYRISELAPTLQAKWDAAGTKMDIKMSIDCKEIVVSGDYAWSMGTYQQIFTPKNGAPSNTFNGKFLTVFHRQPDGSWKICRDCFNSNDPPSI